MNIPELKKSMSSLRELESSHLLKLEHPNCEHYEQALDIVLSACQLLCEASDNLLPKKEIVVSEYKGKPVVMSEERQQEFKEDLSSMIGYNLARSEDILWISKKMMGLEEVIEEFRNKLPLKLIGYYEVKDLASDIRQEMGGGE